LGFKKNQECFCLEGWWIKSEDDALDNGTGDDVAFTVVREPSSACNQSVYFVLLLRAVNRPLMLSGVLENYSRSVVTYTTRLKL
jgi:hypothetical protein